MGWWSFGSSGSHPSDRESEIDMAVPPPPTGALLPPPPRPSGVRIDTLSTPPFTGFSPPPISSQSSVDISSESPMVTVKKGFSFPWRKSTPRLQSDPSSTSQTHFGGSDSKFGQFSTASPASSWADQVFTNPRARSCWESVRMGLKLGSSVGAIFGGLTGTYAAIVHRSPLLIPVSVIGGGASFGFFLGCGMLVRCDTHQPPIMRPAKEN